MKESLFIFMVSLLLIHEMDAIRAKEWKMFVFLEDMADELACKVFMLAHLPLYFAARFLLVQGGITTSAILYYVLDIFLIGHALIHFGFRKHKNNGFTSALSKTFIYTPTALGVIHLLLVLSA